MSANPRDEVRFTSSPLALREIVTVAGDHKSRWEQVFEVLNEALEREGTEQDDEELRIVRTGLDRRTN